MRIYGGILIAIAFVVWFLYRILIKKDLKQHKPALYTYSTFVGVWAIIYLLCYLF